jgi:hypothetical protein
MSHYTKVKTIFRKKSCLVRALANMNNSHHRNITSDNIEVHDKPTSLYGYMGDVRQEQAEIVVRKKNVGSSSNDIGFQMQEDGSYQAIISSFDSTHYNNTWLDSLSQKYAGEVVKETATEQGFSFTEEEINGEIFIHCDV